MSTRLTGWEHDGLHLDVRDTGPLDGPAVVCLHGFPQDGTAYDDVAARLAAAGARVLVPDLRGFSPGARPEGAASYTLRRVTSDVVALLDAAGVAAAHVVGHDWGGAVAWALASRHAERVRSLVALSTPHPSALRHGSQALRSSYVVLFQLPRLPELLVTARHGALARAALERSGLPKEHAAHYATRLQEPGAASATLGWYRALRTGERWGPRRVDVPTTYVVGRRDPFFAAASVHATGTHVSAPYRLVELDAGHWLPETRSSVVAAAVLHRMATAPAG